MKTFPLPQELSNNVVSLDYFKGKGTFYFAQASVRTKDNREHTFITYDLSAGIDTSSFTKGKPYKLCPLFVWTSEGYFKVTGWLGEDKPQGMDEVWEELQEKKNYHYEKIDQHQLKQLQAERENRPRAQAQHQEARLAHLKAHKAHKDALSLKKNDTATINNLATLHADAQRETQEAYDSDSKYQKSFPNQGWFMDKGINTLYAHSWEGSDRNHPFIKKSAGILQVNSASFGPQDAQVGICEYRTPRSGGWQPYSALLHLASMVGRTWTGTFEFRVNQDNSTIVRFEVPTLPPEFSEQKALEETKLLLAEGAITEAEKTINEIISQRQNAIDLKESIQQVIAQKAIYLNDVQLWEQVFLNNQDREGSILPDNFFKAVKEKIQPHGLDNKYRIIPWVTIKQILMLHKVNEIGYEAEFFDCDDYAKSVWAHFPQMWRVNSIFLYLDKHKTMGSGHAECVGVGIEEDGTISAKVIEPQSDKIEKRKINPGGVLIL